MVYCPAGTNGRFSLLFFYDGKTFVFDDVKTSRREKTLFPGSISQGTHTHVSRAQQHSAVLLVTKRVLCDVWCVVSVVCKKYIANMRYCMCIRMEGFPYIWKG